MPHAVHNPKRIAGTARNRHGESRALAYLDGLRYKLRGDGLSAKRESKAQRQQSAGENFHAESVPIFAERA
jgi:hypothetical protein